MTGANDAGNMKSHSRSKKYSPKLAAVFCAGVAFVQFAAPGVQATVIETNLGTFPNITSQVGKTFTDLNGTSLSGHTMSLDFVFTNGTFARLFTVTRPLFSVSLQLQTSGVGNVGLLTGTGYLLDEAGNSLLSPQDLGSASGDDGSMRVGLFPLLSGQLEGPVDFYGVHLDLTFPTSLSVNIIEGYFDLIAAGVSEDDRFGIGPGVPPDIVPDSGGTILLLGASIAAIVWLRSRTAAAKRSKQSLSRNR